jgi:NAD(P)-dependent dehydrogenase (short-subunit alcohol dehydrogenase family)
MNETSEHRIIAILGAYGSIGSALAHRLVENGYQVALGGRDEESLQQLGEETGGLAISVDGRDFGQVESFITQAADAGTLTGVVNCAGSVLLKPAHLTTFAEYEETIAKNLTTAFAIVRAAGKAMRKHGGSIVLMSSAAADIGLANHEAIGAAKAGVAGRVRAAAATYAGRRIRVNAVAPGLVESGATRRIVDNERALEASIRLHPLGRIGQPKEIANLIAWLLGP